MILELIGLFVSLAIYLAIAVPLVGALVRLRANFNPKSIQLDAEGNVEPHTGPMVTSFCGMLARVKRIEASRSPPTDRTSRLRRVPCARAGAGCTRDLVRCFCSSSTGAFADYRNVVPTILETLALTVFVVLALDSDAIRYGARAPNTGILGTLAYATIALVLNLPAVVITFRYVALLSM